MILMSDGLTRIIFLKLSGSIACAIMTKEEEIPVTTIFAASFTMSWIKLLINCTYLELMLLEFQQTMNYWNFIILVIKQGGNLIC